MEILQLIGVVFSDKNDSSHFYQAAVKLVGVKLKVNCASEAPSPLPIASNLLTGERLLFPAL